MLDLRDLRVARTFVKPDLLRLTVPNVQPANSVTDVRWFPRALLPSALFRKIEATRLRAQEELAASRKDVPPPPSDSPDYHAFKMRDINKGFEMKQAHWRKPYLESLRRLRFLIEPQLAKKPDRRLPFAEAGDEVGGLVALSSLLTMVESMERLQRPLPAYIRNFDQARIFLKLDTEAKPGNGYSTYEWGFLYIDSDGRRTGQMGRMTARF